MRWARIPFSLLVVGAMLTIAARSVAAQAPDSALARISRLVSMGDRSTAHGIADSLLGVLDVSAPAYPDALYWRAVTTSNAADAERDYLQLSVEFPLSPKAADGLLTLAQLEYARGDRVAARRHFDRLLREHPTGPHVARASYWSARLSFDEGDTRQGCSMLAVASANVAPDDVELKNQINYQRAPCASLAVRADSTSGAGADTSGASRAAGVKTDAGPQYSVQVAAYRSKASADALASRLKRRGFAVRVVGTQAPYRVRVGRYATREAATSALGRMRRANVNGIVVEAEPK